MLENARRMFLILLCLLTVRAELVQVVTPERVEVITATSNDKVANQKREAPRNGTLDSYLEALKESQGAASRYDPHEPEQNYVTPSQDLGYDSYQQHQEDYGPPKPSYQPKPQETYGASGFQPSKPDPTYGPPQGYQPSKPSYHNIQPRPTIPYGPPSPVSYLPPQPTTSPHQPAPFYGIPFSASPNMIMTMLQNFLPKGIDLETVFKLLLKLTLFKMMVKFIGVICLLLAYPIFQSKEKEEPMMEEEEDRQRQFEVLNDLTALVWDSIYPQRYTNGSDTAEAQEENEEGLVEKVADEIDDKMTAPSEEAAIGFLQFCVAAANAVVGWAMSFVRRRNHEVDPLEQLLWMLWHKIKQTFLNMPS